MNDETEDGSEVEDQNEGRITKRVPRPGNLRGIVKIIVMTFGNK